MKKRILSVLTALCLVLTLVPTAAMAHWVVDEDESGEQPESAKLKVEYDTSDGPVTRYYDNEDNDDWGGKKGATGDHFWDPITVMQDDPALKCTDATITLFEDITLTDTTILVNRNVDVTIVGNGHTINCILTGQQGNDPGSAHVAGQDAISIPGGKETNSLTLDNVNVVITDKDMATKDTQGIYNDGTLVLQNGATVTVSGVNQNGINGSTGTLEMSGEGTKITVSDVGGSAVKSDSITMSDSASIDVQRAAYHGVSVTTLTAGDTSSITTAYTTGGYGVYASRSIVLNGSAAITAKNTSEEKEIRVASNGTFTMNSTGTITGKVSLSAGAKVEGDHSADVPVLEGTAEVDGTSYFTLSEALTAAKSASDKTVTLLKSTTIDTAEIAGDVTLVVPSGLVLTIEDKASLTVNGKLQANGKNVVGASDAAKIVLGADGSFTDGETPVVTDAATYVWGYLTATNTDADVTKGEWKTVEEDVVSTTEYWQAKVAASKESDGTYKPTWEALRNLTFFYDKVYTGISDAYASYAERIGAIGTFITSIQKLDMSDKAIIDGGNTGILEKYTGLTELNLSNTGITEAGGLANLASLETLDLSGNSAISDTHLGSLTNKGVLTHLNLSGTGITDIGGLIGAGVNDTLEVLDISNTKVTKLESIWDASGETSAFSALTSLTAQGLELTSVSGLAEIAKNDEITKDTRWDLSGSILTDDSGFNEGFTQLNAIKQAFMAAGASFEEPSYQATSGSNVAEFNGKLYGTLQEAISAAKTAGGGTVSVITTAQQSLKTDIPANVTLLLPNNTNVKIDGTNLPTVFGGSKGAIQVDAGGTLNIPAASGGSEDFVGKTGARLNLSSGSVLFDIGSQAVTLKAGARAEIPTGKGFFLLMQTGATEKDRVPLNATIETGAELTVSGTLTLPSLEDGSSLTVNGTVDASNGIVDLRKQASVTVGNGGTVKLNGKTDLFQGKILGTATVQSGGTLTIANQEMVGANGNLNVTGGQLELDMGEIASQKISVKLTNNAQVEIPDGKQWTTVIGQNPMRINMDVTIDAGSVLTVSGKAGSDDNEYGFRVAKGSTVTLNGSIQVASGAIMDISSEGTITGSGSISAAGTVNYNAADASKLGCTITLQSGAQVNGKADISAKLVNAQSTTAAGGYTYSWVYKTPFTPPPVNPGDNTGSTGGSSSSGDYLIGVEQPHGGSIRVTPGRADKGDTVTITAIPDDGYELGSLTVTDQNGSRVPLSNEGNGKYTFTMPGGRVSVAANFVPFGQQASSFYDVPAGSYYADAVQWAVEQGITTGTTASTFSPNAGCTRAQIVTFLWRANGSPAPRTTTNPFTDLSPSAYYYDAVLWAVEEGITSGATATTFGPNSTCTRAQAATFLWRAEGSPTVGGSDFSDVADDAYYAGAVDWAVANGVTQGITATTFGPNSTCTRAQIVTFLYRAMA